MNDPALVFVDEPTSSLDLDRDAGHGAGARQITGRGVSAIVVTRDDLVTEFGDRTVHMHDGRTSGGMTRG